MVLGELCNQSSGNFANIGIGTYAVERLYNMIQDFLFKVMVIEMQHHKVAATHLMEQLIQQEILLDMAFDSDSESVDFYKNNSSQ